VLLVYFFCHYTTSFIISKVICLIYKNTPIFVGVIISLILRSLYFKKSISSEIWPVFSAPEIRLLMVKICDFISSSPTTMKDWLPLLRAEVIFFLTFLVICLYVYLV